MSKEEQDKNVISNTIATKLPETLSDEELDKVAGGAQVASISNVNRPPSCNHRVEWATNDAGYM